MPLGCVLYFARGLRCASKMSTILNFLKFSVALLGVLGVQLVRWDLLALRLPEGPVLLVVLNLHCLLVFPVIGNKHTSLHHT